MSVRCPQLRKIKFEKGIPIKVDGKIKESQKIIEYIINDAPKLIDKTVSKFVDEVSMDSPAPGGGSVSALVASLSSALVL